jgi:two-component system, OmpR family, response regulator
VSMGSVRQGEAPVPPSLLARGDRRVLVVDDDSDVVQLLEVSLKFVGFEVDTAADGPEALARARDVRPDAVLLEVTMPGIDGFTVLRRLRAAGVEAPVLFVTWRGALHDKIRGLTAGADDYITKPFDVEEVVVRLSVALRRASPTAEGGRRAPPLRYADLVLDENSREVWKADESITLTPNEFALLRLFILNAGMVLSKQTILRNLWPERSTPDGSLIESYVSALRRKVDRGERPLLHTLRGVGYILRDSAAKR